MTAISQKQAAQATNSPNLPFRSSASAISRPSLLSSSPPSTSSSSRPAQRAFHSSPARPVDWSLDPHASALDIPFGAYEPKEEIRPVKVPIRKRPAPRKPCPQPKQPTTTSLAPDSLPTSPEEIRALLLGVLQQADDTRLEGVLKQLQIGDESALISRAFMKAAIAELEDETSAAWETTWDAASLQLDFEAVSADARGGSWQASVDICILHRLLEWSPGELARRRQAPSSSSSSGQPSIPALTKLARLAAATDFRFPAFRYPASTARSLKRTIHLHVGPTNSGKTYNALKALVKAKRGIYAGPLRLLAHEVWERINRGAIAGMDGVGRACNLVTGEEVRVVDKAAGLSSLTVEMTALSEKQYDVAVFDEIQMIGDPDRGAGWTSCLLNCGAREVHLCGEETVVDLITRIAAEIGDELIIHRYERLSPMSIGTEALGGWENIRAGDCVVRLSRNGIYEIKKSIEDATGLQCAVAYGGLPPELRAQQAAMFNDPDSGVDVMVASDAVGMGLNL